MIEPSANAAWLSTLEKIKDSRLTSKPRGLTIKEVMHHTVKFRMVHPIVHERKRKLSYTFMAAEAMWILEGSDLLSYHPEIHNKLKSYSDDGHHMSGAYGPRIREQAAWVYYKLNTDKETRQCVVEIWRPMPGVSKDIPCTIAMQFLIREEKLNMSVFMRSSDVWMGLPYDMFSFSCIANQVAMRLNVKLGVCSITAGSSHLYYRDLVQANEVLYSPRISHIMFEMPTNRSIITVLQAAMGSPTQKLALEILSHWRPHEEVRS